MCLRELSKKKRGNKRERRDSAASKVSLPGSVASVLLLLRPESPVPRRGTETQAISLPCFHTRSCRSIAGRPAPRASCVSHGHPSCQSQRAWTPVVLATVRGGKQNKTKKKMTVNMKRSLAPLMTRTCLFRGGCVWGRNRDVFLLAFLRVL